MTRKDECGEAAISLFGDELQLGLLLVLLGQLSQAGEGGVHLLDGQKAFGGRGERFTALEEHPDGLRHVTLEKPKEGEGGVLFCSKTGNGGTSGNEGFRPAPGRAPSLPGYI